MTHFTVGIIVPSHELSNIQEFIAEQMAPAMTQALEVVPYVSYSIEKARARHLP